MKRLKLSMTTTGTALFALDVVLVLLAWPVVLWLGRPDFWALFVPPDDLRGFLYPAADLLVLYAMGLYRREAMAETGRSLTRVPLVVGMGCGASVLISMLSRGRALGGEVGSSNAVCAVQRARPSFAES